MVKLITGTIKELHRMKVEVSLSIVNRDYRVLFLFIYLAFLVGGVSCEFLSRRK